jgi:antitoxin (DNA-binding transcriptional repressor) of toxin-antitoxin stability system
MTTRLIGIREFRQNMTELLRKAQEKEIYFIVMRHSEPVAKVAPLTGKEAALEQLVQEIAETRIKAGEGRARGGRATALQSKGEGYTGGMWNWDYDLATLQKGEAAERWRLERMILYGCTEKIPAALLRKHLPALRIPDDRRSFLALLLA